MLTISTILILILIQSFGCNLCLVVLKDASSSSSSEHSISSSGKLIGCERNKFYWNKHQLCDSKDARVNDHHKDFTNNDKDTDVTASIMSTSLALVPYDENAILPHEKPSRQFNIGGYTFTIKQDWLKLGVAAVVWDSAVVLAEYLVANRQLVKGKKVVELGAGTGLTGMLAAALGADVIATEREEAVEHLNSTIEQNVSDKAWNITAQVLDWRSDVNNDQFQHVDVVLGADIIYIEETFEDLLRTIKSLATSSQTQVLLSCKIRYDRDLYFLKLLKEHFRVFEIAHDVDRDIKIFTANKIS